MKIENEKIIQYKFIKYIGMIVKKQHFLFIGTTIVILIPAILPAFFVFIKGDHMTEKNLNIYIWTISVLVSIYMILNIYYMLAIEKKKALKTVLIENNLEKAIKILKWNIFMWFISKDKIRKKIENVKIDYAHNFNYIKKGIICTVYSWQYFFLNEKNMNLINEWIEFAREYQTYNDNLKSNKKL
ncbi:hypothetical protein [Mesomycoplasma lagogenitalium]|uniref:Uncharacterized protein n=1 Tax=Mesomycoplasma lagogenitalium TaxID=171286 RepID=A0ABY8LU38_9BACT|nr:hypothetical protein [Mesomycoplasma lagogenitalium]WGI36759.1 hypothetical protein QEG99_00515 [Mesomycoplasma lagogenitalium]